MTWLVVFLSDPALRQRNRRGLLKGEQIHALARDIKMGKRGRINKLDLLEQRHSCSWVHPNKGTKRDIRIRFYFLTAGCKPSPLGGIRFSTHSFK